MSNEITGKTLLIVWHSRTGAAEAAAMQAYEAALAIGRELDDPGDVCIRRACEVTPDDMLAASAYLFCAPENLASLSGQMKECFDRLYYPVLHRIEGRHFSAIITAGSDGEGALRQLRRICSGWRLNERVPAIILNMRSDTEAAILAPKTLSEAQRQQAGEIGATLFALL
ncbi:flavodoxin family protein [Advenella mimigardefordensis]|uniref:Putative flavodoxin n=1 Tax=Advenella mimigardefordensis (strain DSM 17166 / LMG 22922 / DPN7) TaxID=1247726 RepID=W0PCL1_ADVMD|nr:NAD(P)H-dependent oxidoreductase [Advenella mimigardefordensis]AHG64486.1 putative flavodoxin [Advenella mimigardefordensis DPN7]